MSNDNYRYGRRVTIIGIAVNLIIAAVKLSFGLLGKSAVLVAEAFDSFADIAATTVVLIGFTFSQTPRDDTHPHGHGKIDSLAAFLVGLVVLGTGFFLMYDNAIRIYTRDYQRPEWITLAAVLVAIILKTCLYIYTIKANKKLNSPAIRANAYDHISDVMRLSGVFFGILFAIIGYPVLDPLAAIIVSALIIRMAYIILRDSIGDLIDTQMPSRITKQIEDVLTQRNPEYRLLDAIGRRMGGQYQVTARLHISPYITAVDGVTELRAMEKEILEKVPEVQGIDITTHVDADTAAEFEEKFRKSVHDTLEKHKSEYISVANHEFHFMHNQQEFHCDMFVAPDMAICDADCIRERIQDEITSQYEHAQIIILLRPFED